MIYKLCRRCKKTIAHPQVYCLECTEIVLANREEYKRKRDNKYNRNRDPKYKEFYNSKPWKQLKEKKLNDEQYQCEECKRLAVEVHHIKPIQTNEGWVLRLAYDNLEALCVKCHNKRHQRFQSKNKYSNNQNKQLII